MRIPIHKLPDLNADTLRVFPLERSETIPSRWYTDPGYHRFDQEAVLGQSWQYVGHEQQVSTSGDYLHASIAGHPVVVVRDKGGELRGFYNVCRHRGGPLVMNRCGHTTMLQCKYHGWTYRLDGALRGVPRFDRVDLFDKKDYGLVSVHVATWQGLIFAHLAEEPVVSLYDVLDGIAERIAPLRLDTLTFHKRVTYEVACNWKVYVDNYLEGYHIPLVHPELCNLLDYRAYVTETAPYYSLQYSPFRTSDNLYQADDGEAYYYFVFPNIMLNILPGRLQMNAVIPLAPDRTEVIFEYYYSDVTSASAQQTMADDLAFSDHVQQEDIEICEHVQRGLTSRAYDRGRFSVDCEAGVYHFQCLLKAAYQHALTQEQAV